MQMIDYEPSEVWKVFCRNKEYLLRNMWRIAENPEAGTIAYISSTDNGSKILPEVIVYMDDEEIYSETAVDEQDLQQTVQRVYREYLDTAKLIDHVIGYQADDDEEEEIKDIQYELIDARESDLESSASLFLNELTDGEFAFCDPPENADEIVADFIDHVSEYLYRKWGISVYRPMVLEDENGKEFYADHPYECMEFEEPLKLGTV